MEVGGEVRNGEQEKVGLSIIPPPTSGEQEKVDRLVGTYEAATCLTNTVYYFSRYLHGSRTVSLVLPSCSNSPATPEEAL